jgi:hypothetical protein
VGTVLGGFLGKYERLPLFRASTENVLKPTTMSGTIAISGWPPGDGENCSVQTNILISLEWNQLTYCSHIDNLRICGSRSAPPQRLDYKIETPMPIAVRNSAAFAEIPLSEESLGAIYRLSDLYRD